jgi:hypothetical protein
MHLIPARRLWPTCKGLHFFTETVNAQPNCGVALKESRFADVFTALGEDLARRVAETSTAEEAIQTLFAQLLRWQRFLASSSEGLSEESQRGLWGELHCLRDWLLKSLGAETAVCGWKGPEHRQQDFQFVNGALEVKTTIAKQPQAVRITSERQLDDSKWGALFLHVLVLEVKDNGLTSLPSLIETVRVRLGAERVARELFEDALLAAGYLDAHASRYAGRGYEVRASHWFRVEGKFPRIVEADLQAGVGDTNYALALAACEGFKVRPSEALATLARYSKGERPQNPKS